MRIYTKALRLNSEHIVLKPGTLQSTDDLKPSADIWLKSKQGWFELPTDTKHLQGQPLFEELVQSYEEANYITETENDDASGVLEMKRIYTFICLFLLSGWRS